MTGEEPWGCQIASLETDVVNLRRWQEDHKSTLLRLESRVEQIYHWLIALMGGMVTSLVLMLLNLGR